MVLEQIIHNVGGNKPSFNLEDVVVTDSCTNTLAANLEIFHRLLLGLNSLNTFLFEASHLVCV